MEIADVSFGDGVEQPRKLRTVQPRWLLQREDLFEALQKSLVVLVQLPSGKAHNIESTRVLRVRVKDSDCLACSNPDDRDPKFVAEQLDRIHQLALLDRCPGQEGVKFIDDQHPDVAGPAQVDHLVP